MTALVFDALADRRFETGIDRGVLYPFGGDAVPWNGLTEITEFRQRDVKSYYLDGVKYLDHYIPGSYGAKLKAFTYPDELEVLMGSHEFAPGVVAYDQRVGMFSMSYRTLVGDALQGLDAGYKIHLLYNLIATPSDTAISTVGAQTAPIVFEWNLYGVPATMWGIRPTSHISLDSRRIDPEILETIEELLYGTELTDPSIPDLVDLLAMVEV
jgi:hypothetical protein